MGTLTLEEVHQRLEKIPAEAFGCEHKDCAIGQLHHVMTGETSFGFDSNVYPEDVAMVVAEWNDNLHPENRKALAMMLPLPEAFPALTKERAIKMAAWAGEKSLGYYDGPGEKGLESAVALARQAATSEAYTAEEATAASVAVDEIRHHATTSQLFWVASAVLNMTYTLLNVVRDESRSTPTGGAVRGMARVARHAGIECRPWMQEYLRIRLEA